MPQNTTTRPTEPICPPWCAGHDELFQPWEALTSEGGEQMRDHCSEYPPVHGVGIDIAQEEHSEVGLLFPMVRLYVDRDAELSAAEAIALADRLVAAAGVLTRAQS